MRLKLVLVALILACIAVSALIVRIAFAEQDCVSECSLSSQWLEPNKLSISYWCASGQDAVLYRNGHSNGYVLITQKSPIVLESVANQDAAYKPVPGAYIRLVCNDGNGTYVIAPKLNYQLRFPAQYGGSQ